MTAFRKQLNACGGFSKPFLLGLLGLIVSQESDDALGRSIIPSCKDEAAISSRCGTTSSKILPYSGLPRFIGNTFYNDATCCLKYVWLMLFLFDI
jgi:hypothetical protein